MEDLVHFFERAAGGFGLWVVPSVTGGCGLGKGEGGAYVEEIDTRHHEGVNYGEDDVGLDGV